MAYKRISNQSVLGGIVVLVSLLLLASTTGLYDTGPLFRYVPSLFVLVGLYALVTSGFRNVIGPLVLIAVATAAQLIALGVVARGDVTALWPVLLLIFGLSLVFGRLRPSVEAIDDARVDTVAIFGGRDQRSTSRAFAGGDVTALFGGVELDLRDAEVAAPPARLNATALFGGVDVVVPRDWNVRLDVLPVFGATEDERPRRETEREGVDLVVTGFCAFGGISVTD
jgi:hypothetical protein